MNAMQSSHSPESSALRQSEGVFHAVRSERVRLQHESRMLVLALEELEEEEDELAKLEHDSLKNIDAQERQLLSCLVAAALHANGSGDANDTEGVGNDPSNSSTTSSSSCIRGEEEKRVSNLTTTLCDVLQDYKEAQEAFAAALAREAMDTRAKAQRLEGGEAIFPSGRGSAALRSTASDSRQREALAAEVDLLRELTAEVNYEIDATLLEYGSTLFLS